MAFFEKKCIFLSLFILTDFWCQFETVILQPISERNAKFTYMEAIVIKLEKANVFEKIDRAIPYFAILAATYFVGCWIYAIV